MKSKKPTTPQSRTPMAKKLKQVTQSISPAARVENLSHSVSTSVMLKANSPRYFLTPKKTENLIKAQPSTDRTASKKALINKSMFVSLNTTKTPIKITKVSTQMINLQKPAIERPASPKLVNSSVIDIDLNVTTLSNRSGAKTPLNMSCSISSNTPTTKTAPKLGIQPQTTTNRKQPENPFFRSNNNREPSNTKSPESGIALKIHKSVDLSQSCLDIQKQSSIAKETIKSAPLIEFPYRNLFFGPRISYEKVIRHLVMVYKGLYYVANSLKQPSAGFIESKGVALPPRLPEKKKTLILDLDETLVHSCRSYEQPDAIIEIKSSKSESSKILIKVRPHIEEFFQKVSPYYEIVIFTAASRAYAHAIVEYLDKEHKYISQIFTREDCMETQNGFHIKDLRIFKERDLSELVIVDNLIHSFGFQIDNGIPIMEYFGDKNDQELLHLADYLLQAKEAKDIRTFNRKQLLLHKMLQKDFDSIQKDIFKAFHRPNLNKTLAELYIST